MVSAHATRVLHLLDLQGSDARERALLEGDVKFYGRWDTHATGTTFYVVLADGTEAFHKRHDKLSSSTVEKYGHTLDSPPMHECAAWHFAKALGEEYEVQMPVTVYRNIRGHWGSLAIRHQGSKPAWPAFSEVPQQVERAGFFDVLVGQQDRHINNFMWDAKGRRLLLFDHGFCFPAAGHQHRIRNAELQMQRRCTAPRLTDVELALVDRVLDSGDLLGIAPLLEPARAQRMTSRLESLRSAPQVIPLKSVT